MSAIRYLFAAQRKAAAHTMMHSHDDIALGRAPDKQVIVLVDQQSLTRSCLARALRDSLPELNVHEVVEIEQLCRDRCRAASLVIYNLEEQPITSPLVLQSLEEIRKLLPEVSVGV